jgi:hypothetical protein
MKSSRFKVQKAGWAEPEFIGLERTPHLVFLSIPTVAIAPAILFDRVREY